MMNKNFLLRIVLVMMSLFFLIGAFAHQFGITLFPWYDGELYSPYHDSIIAMAALSLSGLVFMMSTDVVKYRPIIWLMSPLSLINGIWTIWMANTVEFESLYGSAAKVYQANVEGVLLLAGAMLILILNRSK